MKFNDFLQLRALNRLKQIYRYSSNGTRKESVAEHTWACLYLAHWYFVNVEHSLDEQRCYELLMYHDLPEIITGDTPIHPDVDRSNKSVEDYSAVQELRNIIPDSFSVVIDTVLEYLKQESTEARFAKAIDKLEAQLHEVDYPDDWYGYSVEFINEAVRDDIAVDPFLLELYDLLIKKLSEEGYFDE